MAEKQAKIETLYPFLEEMLKAAEENNKDKVEELDNLYESLSTRIYDKPQTDLDSKYDQTRQSLILSVNHPFIRNEILAYGKRVFQSLPRPDQI